MATHGEEQSRDGGASLDVNHGQQTGEVALSGASKEQSIKDRDTVGNVVIKICLPLSHKVFFGDLLIYRPLIMS